MAIIAFIIISLSIRSRVPEDAVAIDLHKTFPSHFEEKASLPSNKKIKFSEEKVDRVDVENFSNQMEMDSPSVNDELLGLSLAAARSEDPSLVYDAFSILINLSSEESSRVLREIISQEKINTYFNEMAFTGMMSLQKDRDLLTDDDIQKIYQRGNDSVKKLAAKILKDRGDNSLANDYVKAMGPGFLNADPGVRLQTLFDVSSLVQFDALPQIRQSLSDSDYSIRLQALNLLGAYGNDMDISAAESLLADNHPQVRAQAQLVIKNLWHKNTHHVMTENQEFAPPGVLY